MRNDERRSATGGRCRSILAASAVLLFAAISSGCGPSASYFIVTVRAVEGVHESGLPEVTPTPAYRELMPNVRVVALSAPDSCAGETAATTTGQASAAGTLLQTTCGVEMAELERTLTMAGYQVASWNAVKNLVGVQGMTPSAAAAQLGAQVLFEINSLEKSVVRPGSDARSERRFFFSDQYGTPGLPATVPEQTARGLEALAAPVEQDLLGQTRLSATINATVVGIPSGQALWFYQGTRSEATSSERTADFLAMCDAWYCRRVARATESAQPVMTARSGSMEAVTLTGRPADEENAIYYQLMRELIGDLVQQFASPGAVR